jgi:hypothetical protein
LIFTCFFGERLNSRLGETGDTAAERNTPSFYFWAARSGGQAGDSQATSIKARAAKQAVAGTWGVCDAQSRHRAQRIAARAAIAAAAAEVASNRAAEKAVAQREAAAMAEAAGVQRAQKISRWILCYGVQQSVTTGPTAETTKPGFFGISARAQKI